jgi:nucleoside-diphosphate-sugar epimerase
MKRVLVTGATGCVGRHVLPKLVARGFEVHALAGSRAPFEAERVRWHRADLLQPGAAAELAARVAPTHLLHLAWSLVPGRWASAPENARWVEASLALSHAFHAAGGRRLVTAGSCLEYDWSHGTLDEARTPLTPHTLYGTCKNALQQVTTAWAAGVGLSAAWGRIFFLYGPHEHPDRLVASVVRALLAGEPARCSHGNQVRDYLYVDDVAEAFVALLESDVTGALNVASGEPVTLKEIVTRIGAQMERPELLALGAIPPAPTDVPRVVADVARLRRELGWSARTSLDAGLARTIAWWRAQPR